MKIVMKTFFLFMLFLVSWSISFGQRDSIRLGLPLGHAHNVISAQFSPDGKSIITASWDKTVIWDVATGKMLHDLNKHTNRITSVQFSPDGKKIVIASIDGTAKIWGAINGEILQNLEGHTSWIRSVHFSPDGKKIVTASSDGTAKIWDAATGKMLHELKGHTESVESAQFSPDGKMIVTSSWDHTAKIWDANTGKLLQNLQGHTSGINSAQFSPDGKRIVTASNDNTAKLWDVATGKMLHELKGHTENLVSASFSPDGKSILTASYDETAKIWDSVTGEMKQDFSGHMKHKTNDIYGLSFSAHFSPDGKSIITASYDETAKLWNVSTGKMIWDLKGHSGRVNSVQFSPDGKSIITACENNTAKIWDVTTGKMIQDLRIKGHTAMIYSAQFSPDGKSIVTSSEDHTAKIWDAAKGKMLQNLQGHTKNVVSAHFSPDGKSIVTSSLDSTAKLWEVATGKMIQDFKGHTEAIYSAQFSPDGKKIVTASEDHTAKIWDVATGKMIQNIDEGLGKRQFTEYLNTAQFSPDGKSVITATGDWVMSGQSSAKIWDITTGKIQQEFLGHTNWAESAYFSPDGKSVVTASNDHTAKIWDVITGKIKQDLTGHISDVNSAQFSHNGKSIVTASSDHTAKIWDVATGRILKDLKGHIGSVQSAQFSPDGTMVLTASHDGSIMLWEVETGKKLLQHFILQNDETVTLAPNGLFDATSGAMSLMYWIKGDEIIDFEQLKDRYWEPGLWHKIMDGVSLRDVKGMNLLKSAPEVQMGSIQQGDLPIILKKRDGGYGKVTLSINGKEVEADARGGRVLDPDQESHQLLVPIANNPLLIPGKENTITVKAWSEDGFVVGRGETILYTPQGKKEDVPPSFHAVICGVNEYSRSTINLRYAVPDAQAVASAMRLGAENLFGKDHTHIYTLTSPGNTLPTKDNIRKTLEDISAQAKPEDILMLYLSGHGITWGGDSGDFYYLTSDAYASTAEAYNDPAIREKTAISSKEFTEWIKKIPALKQVMVIDACGAGKAVENLLVMRNIDPTQIKAIDRMKDRTGMFIISGCAADAVSYEANQYGQGLLTYAILQAMKGLALREDKYVDVTTLLSYAHERVPVMAQGVGGIQKPQLLIPKSGSFDIGILDANTRKNIPLANPKPVFVRSTFLNIEESEDNLHLAAFLDDQLSHLSTRGTNAPIIFVDAKQYPDGCKVSGSYSKINSRWNLKGKMKCSKEETSFEFIAESEKELKEKLATWIIEKTK
jgi:WD40 repeat protein